MILKKRKKNRKRDLIFVGSTIAGASAGVAAFGAFGPLLGGTLGAGVTAKTFDFLDNRKKKRRKR